MGRPRLDNIRKRELVEATISTISEHGLADTTVLRISSAAGVSPGIVHHYFTGKDQLCEAAMRSLLLTLQNSVVSRLRETDDPFARIGAVIDGNFARDQFTRAGVRAWLAFWARAPQSPAIARYQRINARRTRSNLLYDLKKIMPAGDACDAAATMTALMDGLWMRCALSPDEFPPEEARRLTLAYLRVTIVAAAPGETHFRAVNDENAKNAP